MQTRRTIFPLAVVLALATLGLLWRFANPHSTLDPSSIPVERTDASARLQVPARSEPDTALRESLPEENVQRSPTQRTDEQSGVVVRPDGRPVEGVLIAVDYGDRTVERTSRADGSFAVVGSDNPLRVDAQLEGWILVSISQLQESDSGGWVPLQIVMVPVARLELTVVHQDGSPVPDAHVAVYPSTAEMNRREALEGHRSKSLRSISLTDDDGKAPSFTVPAEMKLRVWCYGQDFDWQLPSGELTEHAELAYPVVLEAGELKQLTVRLGPHCWIEGLVIEADGSPSAGAYIESFALDAENQLPARSLGVRKADSDGRFAIGESLAQPIRRVLVSARSARGEERKRGVFSMSVDLPDPVHAAWTIVALDASGRSSQSIRLQLEELPAIAGQVEGMDSRAPFGSIRLLPLDGEPLRDHLISGTPSKKSTAHGGSFRFVGVPPGPYELLVQSESGRMLRFGPVQSGDEAVLISFAPLRPVHVTIELEGDGPIEHADIRFARVDSLPGNQLDLPVLPVESTVVDALDLPSFECLSGPAAQRFVPQLGYVTLSAPNPSGSRVELELDEGNYWFGARAKINGRASAPIGTGLMRVSTGNHHVKLRLREATDIAGRISGAMIDDRLHVALATEEDLLLSVESNAGGFQKLTQLAAGGRFDLRGVPTGHYQLRVGTADELRAGNARLRHAIELVAGEELVVELEL